MDNLVDGAVLVSLSEVDLIGARPDLVVAEPRGPQRLPQLYDAQRPRCCQLHSHL